MMHILNILKIFIKDLSYFYAFMFTFCFVFFVMWIHLYTCLIVYYFKLLFLVIYKSSERHSLKYINDYIIW